MQTTLHSFPEVAVHAPADEQIARLKQQIASAAAATSRLRLTGTQDQYLQSFFLEEALDLQLAQLLGAQRARPAS